MKYIRLCREYITLARECGFFEGYDKSYDFEASRRAYYGVEKVL